MAQATHTWFTTPSGVEYHRLDCRVGAKDALSPRDRIMGVQWTGSGVKDLADATGKLRKMLGARIVKAWPVIALDDVKSHIVDLEE